MRINLNLISLDFCFLDKKENYTLVTVLDFCVAEGLVLLTTACPF